MKNIEVGQIIYVTTIDYFFKNEPNLEEFVVKKVNTRSFYACHKEDAHKEKPLLYRFDKKTMRHYDGFLHCEKYAYLTAEEYWDMIKRQREKAALQEKIIARVKNLKDLETLHKIEEILQ